MQVKTEVNIPYQHFQCTCKIAVYFQVNYNKEWVKSHGTQSYENQPRLAFGDII